MRHESLMIKLITLFLIFYTCITKYLFVSVTIPANPLLSSVYTVPQSELAPTKKNKVTDPPSSMANSNIKSDASQTRQQSISSTTEISSSDISTEYSSSTEEVIDALSSQLPRTTSRSPKNCVIMGKCQVSLLFQRNLKPDIFIISKDCRSLSI